ncbi:hypothetical protein RI129_000604 [Pyrocoelia pectoralis]|uniref:Globin domain-containing protein n=1 Tax=Pyrocoelia pectoralis TaxID=417401 RepID=A0AAN7VKM1_9COLE
MSNAKSAKASAGKAPSLPVYEHPPQVTPVPVATNPSSLPFPEWSDQDINAEKWDVPKPKEKPKPNSPPEEVPQYVDPHFIHMPKSLPVVQWKRPKECFINVPLVMYIDTGLPDIISGNQHLLHSEFIREFIAAVGVLNYLGIHRPFTIEFTTPTYLPTTDGIPWKPWHHIYSMCKGGKGQKHNPQVNQLGDVLISVNAYGTRSALLHIRPGRAVFKMWVKSDNSFIIHLLSDSEIICNTLETILEYMSHESEKLMQMSDIISSSYGQLVQAFGRSEFKDKLTLFYKSYMPPCVLPKKASITVHASFMETFLKQVEDYSPQSEFTDRVFALKVLFLNPTLYSGHSNKCDLKFKTNEDNESDDVASIKLRNVAAMKIQALFKKIFILKLQQIHNDSHKSYFKIFECLKKIYIDIFNVNNRMNRCCDLIRKFLLVNIHMISVRNYYSVIKDLSYTTCLQQFTGCEQISTANSWVAISRHVFHCIHSREISVKINLFCNVPTFIVRVFDNDSDKEIARHTNNVLVYKYSANVHGYTVLSYGWSDREDKCQWKLDFTTMKSHDCLLVIPNVNIYNYVLKYNYTTNANNYMCRCIINIDHDVSFTLRLSANYENVVFRFRCVNELGQVFGEVIGKQNVILPNVMLKYIPVIDTGNYVYNESVNVSPRSSKSRSSAILRKAPKKSLRSLDKLSRGKQSSKDIIKRQDSSQEIKYKDTTYLVEAFVIDDSWPLTNGEWDVVQEIKSKRSIEYLYVPDSQAESSISSKKKRPQSAGSSKCSTGYTLFAISPYWTLEVISNSNDQVTAQIDNRRDEEIIEIKKKWYGDDSERFIKSKLLSFIYINFKLVVFPAVPALATNTSLCVKDYLKVSSRPQVALENNVSQATVLNVLKKEKYHPYKLHLVHELSEDDFDRRLQFCEQILNIFENLGTGLFCAAFEVFKSSHPYPPPREMGGEKVSKNGFS